MIELRLLRYFVAVAEAEHVGRAAQALHISQSPLSRQVRQLEEQLGLALFDRERQRLRLTSAGRWLLGECRLLLDQADQLERDAARVAIGDSGSIRIGFVKSAMWTGVLPGALRAFKSKRPLVSVELRNATSAEQVAAVVRGDLDLGLVHEMTPHAGISRVELLKEPLVLALASNHELARRATIAPKDLDGADWIVLAPRIAKHERLIAACGRAGFVPTLRFEASDQSTVLGLVEAGMGFALLPESAARAAPTSVTLRQLPWFSISRSLFAIMRSAATSPLTANLASCLADAGAKREGERARSSPKKTRAPRRR